MTTRMLFFLIKIKIEKMIKSPTGPINERLGPVPTRA
jgi:hypothetical protein